MRLVVADDLSGAAESAGVAWRHGLDAGLQTTPLSGAPDSLIVLDTDSRLLPSTAAAERVGRWLAGWRAPAGEVYKKTDSVLRGPVRAELQALAALAGCSRVLLVPAIPLLGRTVESGRLLVRGTPLDRTEFAHDPRHPARTADVVERLGVDAGFPVSVASPGDPLPARGIIIGNARTEEHLRAWAARTREPGVLPAGSTAFLSAILTDGGHSERPRRDPPPEAARGRTLICSGTASPSSRENIARAEARGVPVCRLPSRLADPAQPMEPGVREWTRVVGAAFAAAPCVIACVGQPPSGDPAMPDRFERCMAELVALLRAELPIQHLLLEGGATAAAVLRRLGWSRFQVVHEYALGVVCLRASEAGTPLITIKPGSYPWFGPFISAGT